MAPTLQVATGPRIDAMIMSIVSAQAFFF